MVLKKLTSFLSGLNSFTRHQWSIFFVFCFANLFTGCVNSIQAPFYPAQAEKKGATATEYGLVFGVFQIVVFFFSPLFGKHLHRFGAKRVLVFGVLGVGVSCCLFGLLEKVEGRVLFITLSFLIRIIEGIGSAGVLTSTFTIIANEFPNQISSTFALLETFFGLGLIVGPGIGGALFEVGGFMLPFMVNGATLIILAAVTPCVMPRVSITAEEELDKRGFSLFEVLRIPGVLVSAIALWMCSNSVGFISCTLEPHLRQFNLSQVQVGLVFMTSGAAYAISAPIWGKLIDRGSLPKFVMLCGCVLFITTHLIVGPIAFLPFPTTLGVTCLGLVLQGVGVGAVNVAGFILPLQECLDNGFPDNLATYSVVSGLWATSMSLGLFLGPSAGGFLLDHMDFSVASLYPLGSSTIVLGILVLFIIYESRCVPAGMPRAKSTTPDEESMPSKVSESAMLLSLSKDDSINCASTSGYGAV